MPLEWIFYAIVALAAGVTAGLFSIGGGVFLMPALLYMHVPYSIAVGTVSLPVACSAVVGLWRKRHIMPVFALLWPIILCSVPATALGGWLTQIANPFGLLLLRYAYGLLMIYLGYSLVYVSQNVARSTQHWTWPYLLGTFSGLCAGMFGIGGAMVIIPFLLRHTQAQLHEASVTAQWQIMASTGINLLIHGWHGTINYTMAFLLATLTMLGSYAGTHLALHLPVPVLRRYLGVLFWLLGGLTIVRTYYAV